MQRVLNVALVVDIEEAAAEIETEAMVEDLEEVDSSNRGPETSMDHLF